MHSLNLPRGAAVGGPHADLARKANICSKVLAEARRHVQAGRFTAPLGQLVARADELLDEMDELLVRFQPERDSREFTMTASLHRQLEAIQAASSAHRHRPTAE
jgi:hypothetical protein